MSKKHQTQEVPKWLRYCTLAFAIATCVSVGITVGQILTVEVAKAFGF